MYGFQYFTDYIIPMFYLVDENRGDYIDVVIGDNDIFYNYFIIE